ncbi:hypothetical protein [Fimbriiglobus ruber]|uniref:hypothetical protein n=1 Tax=Fimbriiglobus ruber TaxID=1908690 RepID=UPI001EE6B024|nr:hypothetical protein [Fimbriiglobus ruber]
MAQAYVFNFPVTFRSGVPVQQLRHPTRPAGVQSTWIDATLVYFGFATGDFNFDNGIFGG